MIYAALVLGLTEPACGTEPTTDVLRSETVQNIFDRSGREQRGQAAVFARGLAGKRMADGGRFDPDESVAASSTLPLGTTLRVTNLQNRQVAMVRVRDRVSGRNGRILTVSPKVAEFLNVRQSGVFPVLASPLAVPQTDGTIRLGSGTGLVGRRAYVTGREKQ